MTLAWDYLTSILPVAEESAVKADAVTVTKLSTKGQVILPKSIRDRRQWTAGTELTVEETPDGVLLSAKRPRRTTRFEEVFGCLGKIDPSISIDDTDEAMLAEARRRHAGD